MGISPEGYDVRRTRTAKKNTLDLNRNESAGDNANESDVVTTGSKDTDTAARTSVQE
jgi:hypothetical protein